MRHAWFVLALLLLAAPALAAPPPRALPLSTLGHGSSAQRFAILDEPAAPATDWQALGPQGCHGAPSVGRVSGPAVTVTLVGPSGTRVVAAPPRAVSGVLFGDLQNDAALEVALGPKDAFELAVVGVQRDLRWLAIAARPPVAPADLAWLHARGVVRPKAVFVSRLASAEGALVGYFVYPAEGDAFTVVRGMPGPHRLYPGALRGAVALGGVQYLVIGTERRLQLVEIPGR